MPSPIIFELHRSSVARAEVRLAAARKEPGARGPKLSNYFRGDWIPAYAERSPLPPAIDLAGLYAQLLTALMPLQVRPGEELSGAIDRMARIRKLEREIVALDRRVRSEPQFNRKVELRGDLQFRRIALEALTNENEPIPSPEDVTWRS